MKQLILWLKENQDNALLFVRVGVGLMFIFVHGGPKVLGGPDGWTKLGAMIGVLGISAAPTFLGAIAAFSELAGGIMILLGFYTRLGATIILATLIVASGTMLVSKGIFAAAPAIEDALLMILFIFIGAGKYSLDHFRVGKEVKIKGC